MITIIGLIIFILSSILFMFSIIKDMEYTEEYPFRIKNPWHYVLCISFIGMIVGIGIA